MDGWVVWSIEDSQYDDLVLNGGVRRTHVGEGWLVQSRTAFQPPSCPHLCTHQKNLYPSRSSLRPVSSLKLSVTASAHVDLTLFWIPLIIVLANITELNVCQALLNTFFSSMYTLSHLTFTKPFDVGNIFMLSPFSQPIFFQYLLCARNFRHWGSSQDQDPALRNLYLSRRYRKEKE